jgi:hypothetical protein
MCRTKVLRYELLMCRTGVLRRELLTCRTGVPHCELLMPPGANRKCYPNRPK